MFSAMIRKEFLLVLRDKQALMALFIMPAVFILIMSVSMRDIFSQDTVHFDVSIDDLDTSEISKNLTAKIIKNKNFHIVHKKDAQFIIQMPKGFGNIEDEQNKTKLNIFVQGTVKSDVLEMFKSKLLKNIVKLELNVMKMRLGEFSDEAANSIDLISLSSNDLFNVTYNKNKDIPNSTQQSVPAWIVFGMFFIIIPMSTIYINERKQNTLARLNSMNISIFSITFSKIIPYLFIAQVQMWVMVAVGMFIVPLFNTPALEINGSVIALIFLSFALSISAIGLSTLIAASANSSEQATTIGGILNILLGSIGGVMVPKFIMPESMQKLADISPMSWGLDGFLDIFLKGGNFFMVLNESLMLIFFGIIALMISMLILYIRLDRGL
ncbi:MAG: ABC transporter [Epsilonproteobacteria bacterium (ex Lamellibrachia satsuma)]|nr:MAG: ABC transporter [Epsilonproteobacteria bacterium (ex Lamellibrachia satsuma)]